MANISPKLFQKAIQKGLKTALFTTSTAAIMLTSSGALGAAASGVISNANGANFNDDAAASSWQGITAGGISTGVDVDGPNDDFAITYGGDHEINANVDARVIQAINVGAHTPGNFTISEDTSIGSIITNGNLIPVIIEDNTTLTLTGTAAVAANHGFAAAADTYTGLGAITLGGATAGLTIDSATPAKITLVGNIDGG